MFNLLLAKRRFVATWFLSSNICLRKLVANVSCVLLEDEIRSCEWEEDFG